MFDLTEYDAVWNFGPISITFIIKNSICLCRMVIFSNKQWTLKGCSWWRWYIFNNEDKDKLEWFLIDEWLIAVIFLLKIINQ